MNRYFRIQSPQYRKELLAASYCFCPQDYTGVIPLALVDLCNDVIDCQDPMLRETSGYDTRVIPAVKIARIGVHKIWQRRGIGSTLLAAVRTMFVTENRTGCRYLTLDAFNTVLPFYRKAGFQPTVEAEEIGDTSVISMCLDLKPYVNTFS